MAGAEGILGTLRILVDADTVKAQRALKSFGGKAQVAGAAIGAGIGLAAVGALKVGDEYRKASDAIRIGTAATGADLDSLKASFATVAGRVPQDIATVGQALGDLNTRTGKTGEELELLTESVLDLSRMTGGDATASIASITRLYGDWSVAAEDQIATNDLLLRAFQATGMGVDELAQQMVQFGAPLRNLGFDLEDGVAMLSKWEKEGVNTTLALGGLKQALGAFAKEGKDVAKSTEDLFDAIKNADDATWAMAEGVKWFGSRAGPDMVAAIREGRFEFKDFADELKSGTETVQGLSDDTRTLGDGIREAMNKAKVAIGPFTEAFAGIASEMGNAIFLLPALGGAIGKGLAKLLTSGAVRSAATAGGAIIGKAVGIAMMGANGIVGIVQRSGAWAKMGTLTGGRFGKAFGIAAAAAMALIILAEIQELIRVRDENFAQAGKVDDDFANWLKGSPSKAEAQAALAGLRATVKEVDGLAGAIDSIGDLGEGNVLGSGLEFIFGANPSEVVNNQIRALESYIAAGKTDIARTVAQPMDTTMDTGIPKAIREEFRLATAEVAAGFGSIKQALQNPPQMISKGDRLSNMAARMKKVVANIRKATEVGDPMAQRYWEKARAKQQAQIERLKTKSVASSESIGKAYKKAGAETATAWRQTANKQKAAAGDAKNDVTAKAKQSRQNVKAQAEGAATDSIAALGRIKTWLAGVSLFADGNTLMSTLAEGIASGSSAVIAAVDAILAEVKARTQGESPPPKGPLSRIDEGGRNVMEAWLDGAGGLVRQAKGVGAQMASALAPQPSRTALALSGGAGGGGGSLTIQVGTIIADDRGIDTLVRRIEQRTGMKSRKRQRDFAGSKVRD